MLIVGLDNTIGKQCLMATKKQKYFNKGVIIGAIVNLILNIILIPKFNAIGAAMASVISEITILLIFIFYSKEMLDIKKLVKTIIKYSIFSTIMSVIANAVATIYANTYLQGIVLEIISAIPIYIVLLIIFRDNMLKKCIEMIKKGKK